MSGTSTTSIGTDTILPLPKWYRYHPCLVQVPSCDSAQKWQILPSLTQLFFLKPPKFYLTSKPTMGSTQNHSTNTCNGGLELLITKPWTKIPRIHTQVHQSIQNHRNMKDSIFILYQLGFLPTQLSTNLRLGCIPNKTLEMEQN